MGDYLRNARRQRRVSIDRAAEQTRIRADYLMRMESDEFDFLAPAYVRGFLRTYARFLRVSEEPLIEEFDRRYGRARSETSQIVALERRSKSAPRERKVMSSWAVAASLAAIFLVILGVIGLVSGPDEEPPGRLAPIDDKLAAEPTTHPSEPSPRLTQEATPTPTPTPTVTASPSPTATSTGGPAIALGDSIDVQIVGSSAPCWVQAFADGSTIPVFTGTIPVGGRQLLHADSTLSVRLGFPQGVELIVNGTNIGSPGGVDPITLQLPEDVDNF
jgi:cytoskeletal protein RodZ